MALGSRADMRGTERCCVHSRERYTFATCKREQLPIDVPEALRQPTAAVLPQAAPPIRPTTISALPYLPSKRDNALSVFLRNERPLISWLPEGNETVEKIASFLQDFGTASTDIAQLS